MTPTGLVAVHGQVIGAQRVNDEEENVARMASRLGDTVRRAGARRAGAQCEISREPNRENGQ
jgi:hypothetical protein